MGNRWQRDLGPSQRVQGVLATSSTGTHRCQQVASASVASGRYWLRGGGESGGLQEKLWPLRRLQDFPPGQGDGQALSGDGLLGAEGLPPSGLGPSSQVNQLIVLSGGLRHGTHPILPPPGEGGGWILV